MNEQQRRALARVQFSTALVPDSIWRPQTYHVEDLHRRASAQIARAIEVAEDRPDTAPTGFILRGDPGVGKTHLLGWIRESVQARGGFFFMPKLIDGASFWDGAVHGVINRLTDADNGQLRRLLVTLAKRAGCDAERVARIAGPMLPKPEDIKQFLRDLNAREPQLGYECRDTLRALVLFRADGDLRDIADSFLVLREQLDPDIALKWGFRRGERNAQLIFHDLIRLFAASGPVVVALDQIDAVLAESATGGGARAANHADSLMKLREETVRTIITVACIPSTWHRLQREGLSSSADRFTVVDLETALPGAEVAAAVVAAHLAAQYDEVDFVPPYPTWPIATKAFEAPEVARYTPRRLLQLVAEHIQECLVSGEIHELEDFGAIGASGNMKDLAAQLDPAPFDVQFATLRAAADITSPLDPARENEVMVGLFNAALRCFVLERPERDDLKIDDATSTGRAVHARLRRTIDPVLEEQEHWSFRAIAHPHPVAVLSRMRSAVIESGIEEANDKRHLTILRNTAFSNGPRTLEMLDDLRAANGSTLAITHDDLRTFTALREMIAEPKPGFDVWLALREPAGSTQLFRRVFGELPPPAVKLMPAPTPANVLAPAIASTAPNAVTAPNAAAPITAATVNGAAAANASVSRHPAIGGNGSQTTPTVVLGYGLTDDIEFRVPVDMLRKHVALFAGSGSGKTVLLRRLVEELALHGVSSIVIDVNNDLSRLGDAWQQPPSAWRPGDADRAAQYLADTDVVVWTPGRQVGRPLVLNPLPDFAAVRDDPDELWTAVEMAVGNLITRTGIKGAKFDRARAVLRETLLHFAGTGETKLSGLVTLLADLPNGVSKVRNARPLAVEMADGLQVSMINDPLFGGEGEPLDPGVLLAPEPGKKARVSVISCIGLPGAVQRATFVSQLQVALFTFFKTNPARERPLGGLLVLDEAQEYAPAGKDTPATASTLTLAAQARKYGLGIAYATQAPKGLHNKVVGNTATQFFGKLVTGVQIQAARGIAASWGGDLDDIGHLDAGQFYGATGGKAFRKLATPMCLSHHPPSPPTETDVLERARRTREQL
ncbi:ATP-binding protein [Nocardia coubleae]|uniref:ATP-binding protein n=1 Tax=Nocardia coubleae TaxID=356147 RepID=A0A846W5J9_9NOCA|nr:ATP-binding protein [Nocardia coubleae]NKX87798.1 ATP-binding protein [Nocardia coubleae]